MTIDKIEINADLCIGCAACVEVCPSASLEVRDGKAVVVNDDSIFCGHCSAVCPQSAIRVTAIDDWMHRFRTFFGDTRWLPPGRFDTQMLVQLMASRRSCRSFLERPVGRDLLEDLVKIGATAPSGTNSQAWTFTVLDSRKAVLSLAATIAAYFGKLNVTAEKPLLRLFLKLIGKGELDAYYHGYYPKVKKALAEWRDSGRDLLFHGSPAAILVGSRPEASCPAEDALLATQNVLLAAHSMGLSSCLIGYAVAAMQRDSSIQLALGIPESERIHTVIALGYSDEAYERITGRKTVVPRYFKG